MKKYCVHAHRKASTGEVFYIGKGGPQRAKSRQGRSRLWQRTADKHGFVVQIVKDGMPEPCAFSYEKALIASIGRDNLVNLTDGGEGASGAVPSAEHRRKCSISNKGTKPSPHSIQLARIKNSKPIGTRCGLKFSSATEAAKWLKPSNWRAAKAGVCASAQGRNFKAYGYEWGYISNGEAIFLYAHKPKKPDVRPHKWKAVICSNGINFQAIAHAVEWLKSQGWDGAVGSAICRAAKSGKMAYGHGWNYV